jgi:gas vesicle protein
MFRFILGLGVGIGLGMVFAPASGEETREMIAENLGDIAEAPRRKIEETLDEVQQQAGEIGSRLGQNLAESAVEAVRPNVGAKTRRPA